MKKLLILILVFILSSAFAFGIGIAIAEFNIRQERVVVFYPPGSRLVRDKNSDNSTDTTAELPKEAIIAPGVLAPNTLEEVKVEESSSTEENQEKKDEEKVPIWSFAVIGDTQNFQSGNPNGAFQKSVRTIGAMQPKVIISVGDLVSSCDKPKTCDPQYNQWKSIIASSRKKFYAAQGNHDRTGEEKSDKIWQRVFDFPLNGPPGFTEFTYSFDIDNAHFVILSSDKPEEHVINGVQRQWLIQDLTRNKKEHIFVFFHEPAYPVSSKMGESLDAVPSERNALWDILVRYKVDAVFSGHEHIHSRKNINGVIQFIVGNTNAFSHNSPVAGVDEYSYTGNHFALITIEDDKKNVKIYNPDGKELNSFDWL